MVFVRRPFFHYDPARCGMPTLYGTVSERAAKTIRFNTLWQWKGYDVPAMYSRPRKQKQQTSTLHERQLCYTLSLAHTGLQFFYNSNLGMC